MASRGVGGNICFIKKDWLAHVVPEQRSKHLQVIAFTSCASFPLDLQAVCASLGGPGDHDTSGPGDHDTRRSNTPREHA